MPLEHVNLLPKSLKTSSGPDLQKGLVSAWAVAAVALSLATILEIRNATAKENQYEQLAESARSMGASVQEITTKVKTSEEANRKVKETKEFLETRITWTEALKELTLVVPDSVWLLSLTTKTAADRNQYLEIVGEAPTQRKIANFLETLETSYFFREVVMKKSEKLPDVAPDLYRFSFEVEVPQLAAKVANAKAK